MSASDSEVRQRLRSQTTAHLFIFIIIITIIIITISIILPVLVKILWDRRSAVVHAHVVGELAQQRAMQVGDQLVSNHGRRGRGGGEGEASAAGRG